FRAYPYRVRNRKWTLSRLPVDVVLARDLSKLGRSAQMSFEKFEHPSSAVTRSAGAVAGAWHEEELEVFVSLDQRIDHLERRGGIDVPIQPAEDEKELPLEPMRLCHVRLLLVMRPDGPSHPELVPPDLVHAVVEATAIGYRRIVEVAVGEERTERVLSAGRPAEDAHASDVHPRSLRRRGTHPRDAVREAGVADVLPADIVESLRAVRGSHTVDPHDDESTIGDRALARALAEGFRHMSAVRPGVDLLDHRIAKRRVEVA